jgi:AraC family transcriptional regulator, transcriptional activator of pobA
MPHSMDINSQCLDNSNMPSTLAQARPPELPAYALYGESSLPSWADRLHCESIAERSRLHDWEIRPHRHEALFQLLVVTRGDLQAQLEGLKVGASGPAVVTVPALTAHGFRFAPSVEGQVFTVDERHLRALLADDRTLRDTILQPRAWPLPAPIQPTDPAWGDSPMVAAEALRAEWLGHARWRGLAVDAALLRLLVVVARHAPARPAAAGQHPGRALAHLQRYRTLVEAGYRSQPSLAVMAAQVGITPTQLNRICRQLLGHSALGVLHARLVLEAQRELAYTAMSVKQVALGLGFADAAYFTRFFLRCSGHTPTGWRAVCHAGSSLSTEQPK